MKVAVYHPWVYLRGGIERMLSEIATRSRHDWTIFTHHYERDATFPVFEQLDVVELQPPVSVKRSLVPLTRASLRIASCRLPIQGHDALLVSSESIGDFVTFRNRLPSVCYCLTPLKILFDPATRDRLQERNSIQAAGLAVAAPWFRVALRRAWRRYDRVLAVSEEVRGRIRTARLVPDDRVEVLYPGVDLERFRPVPSSNRSQQLLVAGRIMWQKRIELAIDAFGGISPDVPGSELVIAGAVDEKSRPYLAELRHRAAGMPVRFETDPTDDRMAALYASSKALIATAPNEDFGLVVVEAMASGTPVIAVDQGGPTETVIDGVTGWLLPPDPSAFATRMAEVLGPAIDWPGLEEATRRRAADFSWARFVHRLDDVMEAARERGTTRRPGRDRSRH